MALARRLLRGRDQAFALSALAGQLAGATDGFSLLASALFRRLFVVHVPLHLAERAFALHLLLQRLQGLIDVVVADENLNQRNLSCVTLAARLDRQKAASVQKWIARRCDPSSLSAGN